MAHDDEDSRGVNLLRTLPVVHALRKVTEYPIIVMTNATHFGDGSEVVPVFQKLNVDVWPILPVDVPESYFHWRYGAKCKAKCGYTYWKLQAWKFTQFDKVITFDTDAIVTRNFDALFELQGTWAQEEDWWCRPARSPALSGGFVILEPSLSDYEAMLSLANSQAEPTADQGTLTGFFGVSGAGSAGSEEEEPVRGAAQPSAGQPRPVKLIDKSWVDYGQCMPSHHASPPAFVHKSDRNNHCFTIAPSALQQECEGNPMARLWRSHLCAATADLAVDFPGRRQYCP